MKNFNILFFLVFLLTACNVADEHSLTGVIINYDNLDRNNMIVDFDNYGITYIVFNPDNVNSKRGVDKNLAIGNIITIKADGAFINTTPQMYEDDSLYILENEVQTLDNDIKFFLSNDFRLDLVLEKNSLLYTYKPNECNSTLKTVYKDEENTYKLACANNYLVYGDGDFFYLPEAFNEGVIIPKDIDLDFDVYENKIIQGTIVADGLIDSTDFGLTSIKINNNTKFSEGVKEELKVGNYVRIAYDGLIIEDNVTKVVDDYLIILENKLQASPYGLTGIFKTDGVIRSYPLLDSEVFL